MARQRTVTDNTVEVIFEFSDATINVGDSNMDDILGQKVDKKAVDGLGKVWFTTNSSISPMDSVDNGGMGSTNVWDQIGDIQVGSKTVYVWECTHEI